MGNNYNQMNPFYPQTFLPYNPFFVKNNFQMNPFNPQNNFMYNPYNSMINYDINNMNPMQQNPIKPNMNNTTLNSDNKFDQMVGIERIIAEYIDLCDNPMPNMGLTLSLVNESDYRKWRITLIGPNDTPYKNGLFIIEIVFPEEYPEKHPECYFITPIYHVSVCRKSKKINDEGGEKLGHTYLMNFRLWKPENKMRGVIYSIFNLFSTDLPDSPYRLDLKRECLENKPLYEEKIKYFTKKYANAMINLKEFDGTKDWDFSYPKK